MEDGLGQKGRLGIKLEKTCSVARFETEARGTARSLALASHWNFWDISFPLQGTQSFTPAQWTSVAPAGRKAGRYEVQSPHEVPPIPRQTFPSSCHIHLPEQWNKDSFTPTTFMK